MWCKIPFVKEAEHQEFEANQVNGAKGRENQFV
jgi:hypothetical protein